MSKQYTVIIKAFKTVKVKAKSNQEALDHEDVDDVLTDLDFSGFELDEAYVENKGGDGDGE